MSRRKSTKIAAALASVLLAGCSDPPKKRGTVVREPVSIADASTSSVSAPTPAGPTPVDRYLATHEVPDRISYALRNGALAPGMDQEQVLLVIDRRQVIGSRPVADHSRAFESWELREGQRWQRLLFDRGVLKGWRTWDGKLELWD